jgi:multidrug efflux pump subunit AcrA (membrane-fusion protein)
MVEKRNRNGGRDREEDRDDEQGSVEAEARHVQEAPQTKPAVQAKAGMGAGTRLVLLLLIIALAGLGYRYWGFWQGGPTEATAPPPPAVTVAKPLVKDMQEWSDFTGQFEARESVEVRPRVSGYLESINFNDGQLVKKGDLLFVIEPRPFELALETAKAQQAQNEAQLELAKAQLERTAQLRKNDYATQETYDERVAQVNIATASRDAAIAAVNQAQLNLDYTRVTAPVSGRMGRHEVSVGNLIVGGIGGSTTLLTTIVSLDPIWLSFNVSEGDGMTYKRLVQKGEIESALLKVVSQCPQFMGIIAWMPLPPKNNTNKRQRRDERGCPGRAKGCRQGRRAAEHFARRTAPCSAG